MARITSDVGSLLIFLRRPIAAAITLLALFFFVLPAINTWRRRESRLHAPVAPHET